MKDKNSSDEAAIKAFSDEEKNEIENSGRRIAELAAPLIAASSAREKNSPPYFHRGRFIMILSKIANLVLLDSQVTIKVEKIDFDN